MATSTSCGGRTRSALNVALVVLTAFALAVSTVAVWVRHTALDTQAFVALVEPALSSEEVTTALAVRVTDETLEVLAIEERLEQQLEAIQRSLLGRTADALGLDEEQRRRITTVAPDVGLERMAAPMAAAVEERVATTIDAVVGSEQLRSLLLAAVEEAHADAVLLLRGQLDELPTFVVADGVVSLDLRPVIGRALVALRGELLASLGFAPPDQPLTGDDPLVALRRVAALAGYELDDSFGRIPVMDRQQLEQLQATARALDRGVWAIVVATLLLVGASLVTASSWRRGLRDLAVAAVVALGAGVLVLGWLPGRLAARLARTPEGELAVLDVASTTLASLERLMLLVLLSAGLVLLGSWLAARSVRPGEPPRSGAAA